MNNCRLIFFVLFIFLSCIAAGQSISFRHLNISNSLSHNNVQAVTIDKNGFLWIGTAEGLNVYNGYSVTNFFQEKHPQLPANSIDVLLCDSKNQVWAGSSRGAMFIDANRKMHRIALHDTLKEFNVAAIIETKAYGIIIISDKGQFYCNEKSKQWMRLAWSPDFFKEPILDVSHFKNDEYLVSVNQRYYLINYARRQITDTIQLLNARAAAVINDDQLLLGNNRGVLILYSVSQKKIMKTFNLAEKKEGQDISINLWRMRKAANREILIGSQSSGLIRFNYQTGYFSKYTYDPLIPNSGATDLVRNLYCHANGDVVLMTRNAGLSIFNINSSSAEYFQSFADSKGLVFSNFINGIAEDKNGMIWMGSYDRLIKWNREQNKFTFYPFFYTDARFTPRFITPEIKNVCVDNNGKIWFSAYGAGFGTFNAVTGKFTLVPKDTVINKSPALRSNFIHDFLVRPDGTIWCCSGRGIYSVNSKNLQITTYDAHPLLKQLTDKRIFKFYMDKLGRLWMGTEDFGAYCYDEKNQTLNHYSVTNGLSSNTCYAFTEDNYGNIYIGTPNGLNILRKNGSIKIYNRSRGLRANSCEGFLKDDAGNIWFSNHSSIIRYNPVDSSIKFFDENAGLSTGGFRTHSNYKTSDGLMIWGTEKGLNHFYPEQLKLHTEPLQVSIYQIEAKDSVFQFTGSTSLRLPYSSNDINFHFTAISLTGSKNVFYQYKLQGIDNGWSNAENVHQVKYNALPSGKYVFKLKASKDGINWFEAKNTIAIEITPPFWQTWWFRLLIAGSVLLLMILFYRRRINYLKQQQAAKIERLNAKQADAEKVLQLSNLNHDLAASKLTALRAQMNPHFIFNALNSVQQYMLQGNVIEANKYLSKFSKLQREILDYSDQDFIFLEKEMEMLSLYLQLEQLRFDDTFRYMITVDEAIDPDEIKIPPMLVQPFVENAIWHGLMPKQGERKVEIHFALHNDEMLVCSIKDNGIGREAAGRFRQATGNGTRHISKGLSLVYERLNILRQQYNHPFEVTITDLVNNEDVSGGTLVTLTLFAGH